MSYPVHETRTDLRLDMEERNLLNLEFNHGEIVGTVTRVGRDFFELEDRNGEVTTHNIADILYYRLC